MKTYGGIFFPNQAQFHPLKFLSLIAKELNIFENSYVKEMTCAFLSGEKDIDTYWDTYLKDLEDMGLSDYIEILQTAYDRVH